MSGATAATAGGRAAARRVGGRAAARRLVGSATTTATAVGGGGRATTTTGGGAVASGTMSVRLTAQTEAQASAAGNARRARRSYCAASRRRHPRARYVHMLSDGATRIYTLCLQVMQALSSWYPQHVRVVMSKARGFRRGSPSHAPRREIEGCRAGRFRETGNG